MLQVLTTASVLATLLIAKPSIEIGCSFNRHIGEFIMYDGYYYKVYEEFYWGLDAEITVNLIKYAGVRIRPLGLRMFDRGGYGLNFFKKTQFDITLSPFGNSRFKPYLIIGYVHYSERQKKYQDLSAILSVYQIQIGPGFQFRPKSGMNIFLECTMFDKYQTPAESYGYGYSEAYIIEALGVTHIYLGIKFRL